MRREDLAQGITLYLGDSREILPTIGNFDVLVTDPPYGVEFNGKKTKYTNNIVDSYVDNDVNFTGVILPIISLALKKAKWGAIFSGTRKIKDYPRADEIGGIVCPNGGGRSPWGFGCFHPILFYGKSSPHLAAGMGGRPTAAAIYHPGMHVTGENDNDHPCPKPIMFMQWLINFASLPGQSVVDPFMGSGTTGVAAVQLNRAFTGIEISMDYFDIACRRISEAINQKDFFITKPMLEHQLSFDINP